MSVDSRLRSSHVLNRQLVKTLDRGNETVDSFHFDHYMIPVQPKLNILLVAFLFGGEYKYYHEGIFM